MSTLHLVNTPGADSTALANCLRAALDGDTVLLIGNGVFCAVAATFTRVRTRKRQLSWCAVSDDIASRGIGADIAASVRQIDDAAFVDLVATHQPIVSWS